MSLSVTKKLNVDLHDTKYITLNAKQFDRASRFILVTCYDQGNVVKLSNTINYAYIRYKKADDLGVFNSCKITDDGKILVELTEQMLAVPGMCYADLVLLDTSSSYETSSIDETVSIVNDYYDGQGNLRLIGHPPIYATDDNQGNVTIASIAESGEIVFTGADVISTMLFCINVIGTALNNINIESSSEYNGLSELLSKATVNYEDVINRCNTSAENAEHYYEQIKTISNQIDGGFIPNGTITFSELNSVVKEVGYTYHISDDFITDDTFKSGAGISYPAGTNVYYTADGYWDCLVELSTTTETILLLKQIVSNLQTRVSELESQIVLGITK